MAPLDMNAITGTLLYNLVFLALGVGFGSVLELSGFGDTRKLAAQFYFRDMTVLKVMFTGIIVASTLIFLSASLGLLDFNKLWVNPTYLWPGIIGGLIMGVGFILGGFCPGTSLVAAATLKIDGIAFVLGVVGGVYAFGETVGSFDAFWHSSAMGRFTLPELLGLPTGVVVVLLVLMALGMFVAAEAGERYFAAKDAGAPLPARPKRRAVLAGAAVLIGLAVLTALIGQPTVADRWDRIATEGTRQLSAREVFVDPREIVDLKRDTTLTVSLFDLRDESDFNLFHIDNATRIASSDLVDDEWVKSRLAAPENVIHVLVSNDDAIATEAWKTLKAQGVLNLYVLDGGVNNWLRTFPVDACVAAPIDEPMPVESLRYRFAYAVGDRIASAHPDFTRPDPTPGCLRAEEDGHAAGHAIEVASLDRPYEKKVKLQRKTAAKGGCG